MPTTNDKRLIKITSKTNVTASEFSVDLQATVSSPHAIELRIRDRSEGSSDRTIHEFVLQDPATGQELGRTSLRLRVDTVELGDLGATIERVGRGSSDPPAGVGGQQLRDPDTAILRRWAQPILRGRGDPVLRNVAVIDLRSASSRGAVSHTVRTNDPGSLVLGLSFADRAGAFAEGTITVGTVASAGPGFSLGPVRITDREDDEEAERRVIR